MNIRLLFQCILLPFYFLLPLTVISCGDDEPRRAGDHDRTEEVYEVRGRYLSTDLRGESISVVHETIPEVMNAMRMSLRIDDEAVAVGLQTGDIIGFDMVRTETGWFARNIEVLPPDTDLDLPEHLREVGMPQ